MQSKKDIQIGYELEQQRRIDNPIATSSDRDDCGGTGPDTGCDGVCFSGLVDDCAGDCDGSATVDCAGVCDGASVVDDCGVCDGGNASMDCAGVCDGASVVDDCGECDGGNASMDCAGTCGGDAFLDCNGSCADAYYLSWQGDVRWTLGDDLAGGAPFDGCFGTCEEAASEESELSAAC